MFPTVAEVLDLPAVRQGRPRVAAGAGALGRTVRWTHVAELSEVDVAGIVIELGRRFTHALPETLVRAAEHHKVCLIELRRETPFVRITESVHALIVDAQLAELRISEQVHQTFTELSIEGAEPGEVIRQTARMAGAPVVLENLSH